MSNTVVFIGAAGEMCQVAVRRFAKADPEAHLVLCDIRPELLADLAEVLALSDRVAVMYGGRIVALLPRSEASPETLGPYMTGAERAA